MKLWIMAAGFISVSVLQAEPVRTQYVSPQAVWAAHLDLDLVKNAQGGLCAWLMEQTYEPETARKLAGAQRFLGFDLRQALSGVTVYGLTQDASRSAALFSGRFDVERLQELLGAADSYSVKEVEGYEIHSWTKKDDPEERSFGAFRGTNLLFFASASDVLLHALKVVDGKEPGGSAAGVLDFVQESALLTAAFKSGQPLDWPKAGMLKMASAGAFTIEESGDDVRIMLALEVAEAANAENIYRVAEGLRAMVLLSSEQKPEMAELARRAVVEKKEGSVLIALNVPATQLVKVLKEGVALKKVKKAAMQ